MRGSRCRSAELKSDPHRSGLADAKRNHESQAGDIERQLMRRECVGAKQAHENPSNSKDPDF
jgi:hypothetical protein